MPIVKDKKVEKENLVLTSAVLNPKLALQGFKIRGVFRT